MPEDNGTISSKKTSWAVKDIVYISIIGPVMIAAFLEWFLWLAAFCYCLFKVLQKANDWTTRRLAITMMILFVAFRGAFLPVMVVTLPLPAQITEYFPRKIVSGLEWFAFWTFAILLVVPWLLCIYRLATSSLGRAKKITYTLDERTAPKIVIVMPVYKEECDVLLTAINSVVNCEYPSACIHVFLSFDGDQIDELYLSTLDRLGIPIDMKDIPPSIDVAYNGARVTVSRFPHGGKRKCQKATFKLIDKIYSGYLEVYDDLFILFIDSDCILDKVCIQNFLYDMELKPGSKHNMLAMTGVITATTEKRSLITLLQDMEYLHGQLFERSVESSCGSVTCLPGALTILRFSAFRNMARFYFADKAEQCEDFFDYGKCHLGEDRWLTHLFMVGSTQRYQIQMCTNAFCKTEAVQTFRSLLKQRRRWFLGFITNEVCMFTDIRIWRRYTVLCVLRFLQDTIRTTALLFFIMVISLLTTSNRIQNLPVGFIAVSLGLNYILMLYFGAKIGRFKAWLYPLMFILSPFLNWVYLVYGVFTAGQRTWGGPRADAGAADAKTTPQQAIEHAQATGDDLNIVPETFRQVIKAKHQVPRRPNRLQPSESVEGRFVPNEPLPGRRLRHTDRSALLRPSAPVRGRAESFSSIDSSDSLEFYIHTPRRVTNMTGNWCEMEGQYDGAGSRDSDLGKERGRIIDQGRVKVPELTYHRNTASEPQNTVNSLEPHPDSNRRRAAQSAPQSFEPDPRELYARLSRLGVPQPTYDGMGRAGVGRSPLGRLSPAICSYNELLEQDVIEAQSLPNTVAFSRPRRRRSSSERRRLQKRHTGHRSVL